jgi:hypothetical protein
MPFQNKRPNNHGRILVFSLAKKQQIYIGILLGVGYVSLFDLILHIHTLLIKFAFYSQMKVWETGLPNYWKKVSIHQAPKCFTNRRPEAAKKMPIRLNDLLGAFLILGFGLGLATLTFFTENIIMFYHLNHNV